ncbi:MAG: primase-helicase family protein [Pseudomonadota bacterium]
MPTGGSRALSELVRRDGDKKLTPEERALVDAHLARLADLVERRNLAVETALQADTCHNADRIMRLPGTVNVPDAKKRKKGRTARLASVVEVDWTRLYRLDDLPSAPEVVAPAVAPVAGGRVSRAALASDLPKVDDLSALHISDRWQAIIVQGTDIEEPGKYASRSEALWAVLCHLVRAGVPDTQIAAVILDPDYKISGHVLDQPNPRRYAVRQIERAHEEAVEPWLRKLNDSFLIVGSPKCRVLEFVAMPTGRPGETRKVVVLQSLEDFRNRFMNRYVTVGRTKNKDGKEVDAEMPVGKWWLTHPMRRQFHSLTFEPLSGEVVGHDLDDPDSRQLNLWTGFAVKPRPGDWSRMRAHILNVLANGDQRSADYILRWMAWTVQNPDRPAEVALTFRGEMGTGKGLFGREMARLFGQHGLHTGGTELISGRFNKHFADCCLLFADEITWDGDKKAEARMKVYLTEDTIAIEGKGADVTSWPNRLHVIISSNSQWVVPAGAHERRYVVFDVSAAQRQNREYFRPLYAELEGGGREAMLHDLLAMDLGDWHPRDNRPDTAAMADQKSRSLDPLLADLLDMLREGSPTFAQWDRRGTAEHPFISSSAMADRITAQHRVKITMNAVGGALERIGAVKSRNDRPSGWVLPTLSEARARWNADPDLPTQAWDDAVDWAVISDPMSEPTPF